jgi:hypothetical protein
MKIYLSYGMEFADYQESYDRSIKLRTELQKLGYETFNPHTDECELKGSLGIYNKEDLPNLRKNNLSEFSVVMKEIIKSDLAEIHYTDAIVAYLDKSARGGVPGELTVASLLGIPVYSIVNPDEVDQISGWTLGCSDFTFSSIEECIEHIRTNPII